MLYLIVVEPGRTYAAQRHLLERGAHRLSTTMWMVDAPRDDAADGILDELRAAAPDAQAIVAQVTRAKGARLAPVPAAWTASESEDWLREL